MGLCGPPASQGPRRTPLRAHPAFRAAVLVGVCRAGAPLASLTPGSVERPPLAGLRLVGPGQCPARTVLPSFCLGGFLPLAEV